MSELVTNETLQPVLDHLDKNFDAAVERLQSLLRIPSVSTDPAFADDVQRCAEHLADDLRSIGLETTVHNTKGHPMVVATDDSAGSEAPRVLYYGHYDVQPVQPLDEWDADPFEATVVEGPLGKRIVARGAADDKGQLMTFVEAIRSWKSVHGKLPVRDIMLFEGEEECGSESLEPFLQEHKNELLADTCIVCDTSMWDIDTPAITSRLRGLVNIEMTLHGPTHDLHSGGYGGAVVNPANAITEILGQLHDDDGRVQIPRFYDDVDELSAEQAQQWSSLGDADALVLESSGASEIFGEKGFTTLERLWARPTCDINGLFAGYTGQGAKTVIGASATAKISCRLVACQNPQQVEENLRSFLKDRTPAGCRMDITSFGVNPAISVSTQSPWITAASAALTQTFPNKAVMIGSGGSIPVVGSFQEILGVDSVLVGFSLDDDLIHAPNEKYELACFHRGMLAHATILDKYASTHT